MLAKNLSPPNQSMATHGNAANTFQANAAHETEQTNTDRHHKKKETKQQKNTDRKRKIP